MTKKSRKGQRTFCSEAEGNSAEACINFSRTSAECAIDTHAAEAQLAIVLTSQRDPTINSDTFEEQFTGISDIDIEQRLQVSSPKSQTAVGKSFFNKATTIKRSAHLAMVVFTWLSSSMLLTKSDVLKTQGFVREQDHTFHRRLGNARHDPTKELNEVEEKLRDHVAKLAAIKKHEKDEKKTIAQLERKKQRLAGSEMEDDDDAENEEIPHSEASAKKKRKKENDFDVVWSRLDMFIAWLRRSNADKRRKDTHFATDAMDIGFWSWMALAIMLLCCGACQLMCFMVCCCRSFAPRGLGPYNLLEDFQGVGLLELCGWLGSKYQGVDARSYLPVVRREARFMMLMPLIPVACLPWTTCEGGTPDIAYYIYMPFLVRARAIEFQLLIKLGAEWTAFVGVLLFSTFEHADWFTDGTFPVQAYVCDEIMTPGLAHALHMSRFPFLAGLVLLIRFYGLAVILFLSAAFSQQAMASSDFGAKDNLALAADTAAYTAVADITDVPNPNTGFDLRKVLTCGSKVLLENCLQLRLQSSGFSLTFAWTTRWAKIKSLLSLMLGAASAISKVVPTLLMLARFFRQEGCGLDALILISVCVIAPLLVIAWTAAQLYYSFICPTHLWNMSTGCVPIE